MRHSQIAHYQITSQLGKGGMGEVYRAGDTKLNRDGQRFLINTIVDESTAPPITIVTNWARALKK